MAEIDQFKQYIYLGYTNRKIAEYLGCSERTVKSRRKEYNLRNKDVQSAVHDAELDEMVKAAVGKNPSYGEKMVAGLLASKNVHVQRDRIRQSIRRVDPDGVDTRKRVALHRRQYSVPGPNSLWHIDGNHKLISLLLLQLVADFSEICSEVATLGYNLFMKRCLDKGKWKFNAISNFFQLQFSVHPSMEAGHFAKQPFRPTLPFRPTSLVISPNQPSLK
ncbi:uncharacterized protein [Apostichopus japonicus]|uniref:uncharacterized protein isoform X3 n=1 Tax=Stichopus japonicus TaxID=307972 RepID=UPI003AB1E374